jgi:hypothetical protein
MPCNFYCVDVPVPYRVWRAVIRSCSGVSIFLLLLMRNFVTGDSNSEFYTGTLSLVSQKIPTNVVTSPKVEINCLLSPITKFLVR